jgi:hypothetical protein
MVEKRGQVTIFIIIGVVIVLGAILIFLFFPKIRVAFGFEVPGPSDFIKGCVEEDISDVISVLSSNGGSVNPLNYFLYNEEKIGYLCYSNEIQTPCVAQQPMLKSHIESEIKGEIKQKSESCFDSLKESYEKRGYSVEIKKGDLNVEILPLKVVADFNTSVVLTKEDTQKYDSFSVVLDKDLYGFIGIANSIVNNEILYGDSETTTYMNYYHDLKVEKKKQDEGSVIYILEDRDTGEKFKFASRSFAYPRGGFI